MKVALVASCLATVADGGAYAGVDIYIDKSSQRMTVAVDGVRRYTWPVSTGKFGYGTPSGTFRPFRMERHHFSEEWDDAPMPHSIFFTYQGHAIHGSPYTARLGRAVSHGCVRLAPGNAAKLYSLVTRKGMGNTRITVAGGGIALGNELAPVTREIRKVAPRVKRNFGDWLRVQRR
jgi:lipoprotein-anchoring transpeptidase ErfK/SrfK